MSESFLAVAETGNFTRAAESGKLDLIFTIRDSVKNVEFERKAQSDCVHEQAASELRISVKVQTLSTCILKMCMIKYCSII